MSPDASPAGGRCGLKPRCVKPSPLDQGKVLGCPKTPFFFVPAEQRMVLVACGPYTTSDSIAYDPLADLVEVIVRDRPDVCVLVRGCSGDGVPLILGGGGLGVPCFYYINQSFILTEAIIYYKTRGRSVKTRLRFRNLENRHKKRC